jgi:hypothetical protein
MNRLGCAWQFRLQSPRIGTNTRNIYMIWPASNCQILKSRKPPDRALEMVLGGETARHHNRQRVEIRGLRPGKAIPRPSRQLGWVQRWHRRERAIIVKEILELKLHFGFETDLVIVDWNCTSHNFRLLRYLTRSCIFSFIDSATPQIYSCVSHRRQQNKCLTHIRVRKRLW